MEQKKQGAEINPDHRERVLNLEFLFLMGSQGRLSEGDPLKRIVAEQTAVVI